MQTEAIQNIQTISVVGLGYVGLPIALEFAKKFSVIAYDHNHDRIVEMQNGVDPSNELPKEEFENKNIHFTSNPQELSKAQFHIIAVPTPVDEYKIPDLSQLKNASATIGNILKRGDYVIYESTVYPGCTEEDCLPILESESQLKGGIDFKFGYSPERIVPGVKEKSIEKIIKVVSGCDPEATDVIGEIYSSIIEAGIYKAKSIKIAEAAKIVENIQRDLNISLMNELALIFDKMGIDTKEVIEAAGTKWNFQKYYPGLVGGHCIGVDPYYLLHKSKQHGYDPQVILSGRRINDSMPSFIAKKLVQILNQVGKTPQDCSVLILGITFKENVSDVRNSKVVELVKELNSYSLDVSIVDPNVSSEELKSECEFELLSEVGDNYDAVIVAVAHDQFKSLSPEYFNSIMKKNAVLMDIKGIYNKIPENIIHWRL